MLSPINGWLSNVENVPPPYVIEQKRKREAQSQQCLPQKRQALGEMPSARKDATSSRRGRRKESERVAQTLSSADDGIQAETPRRTLRTRGNTCNHDDGDKDELGEDTPRPTSRLNLLEDAPDLSPVKSKRSKSTSNRSRSSSPRKIASLAALPEPITYVEVSPYDDTADPPQVVSHMLEQVAAFANGEGVIPVDMQEELRKEAKPGEFRHDYHFDITDQRLSLGTAPPLARVDEICYDTRFCSQHWVHEAAWNCESQHPIGKLAWRYSRYKKDTRWENITVADITPRGALLPPNTASRPPDATRIDFGIVLESSPNLDAALPYLEPVEGTEDPSWNPTTLSSIAHNPLVAVVETKRKGADTQNAEYQIGIWAFAMFKRMRLLVEKQGRDYTEIPPLPLLAVEGDLWELHVATQDEKRVTTVWKYGPIGRANTRLGIYQIIAVLQFLLSWAENDFRPWFEKHCLPVMPI